MVKLGTDSKYLEVSDDGKQAKIVIKRKERIFSYKPGSTFFKSKLEAICELLSEKDKDLLYDLIVKPELNKCFDNFKMTN